MTMSPRLWCAIAGIVFGIVWASISIGWAAVVLLCALAGYAVGAALEGTLDVSGLVAPLRQPRR